MSHEDGVEQQKSNEVSGEELFFELDAIREITDVSERVKAWEVFLDTYSNATLDETAKEIIWRAEMYLKTDRASAKISELVG